MNVQFSCVKSRSGPLNEISDTIGMTKGVGVEVLPIGSLTNVTRVIVGVFILSELAFSVRMQSKKVSLLELDSGQVKAHPSNPGCLTDGANGTVVNPATGGRMLPDVCS